MNSCPEFHCPVITDLCYLFMLQGQHGHCPPPKRLIPGASCPPLNLWCELPLLLILATRLPMKDKMPGPWHRKRFSELVTKGGKKRFFSLLNWFFRQWNITWLCVGKLFTELNSSGLIICFPVKAIKGKLLCLGHWTVLEKVTETGQIVALKYPLPFHSP